jgi:D-alanyl-D-alanine carboxypeptidase
MALLGRRLMKDFPDRFGYFATPHFRFRGRVAFNHNRLLQEYEGKLESNLRDTNRPSGSKP